MTPLPISLPSVKGYCGRFAPSPSGNLHFGSLCTALASYLQARKNNGRWLLRIDDLDPPREVPGAADSILATLDAHGLHWDGDVLYQSKQQDLYNSVLAWMQGQGAIYACSCTRKRIQGIGGTYDGHCRELDLEPSQAALQCNQLALRLRNQFGIAGFQDEVQGRVMVPVEKAEEDFIVRRRDGLVAYHLAAVIDDIYQGVSQVVRGADLLLPSACQLNLYRLFQVTPPSYLHIPVAQAHTGLKLSKQNRAKELNNASAGTNLVFALRFIGIPVGKDLVSYPVDAILDWAIANWDTGRIPPVEHRDITDVLRDEAFLHSIL